jgi:tRNA-uridine 2-sulfurtransferase
MSGGADSLRAAALLKAQGHEVSAIYMRSLPHSQTHLWDGDAKIRTREHNLKHVAAQLNIPLTIVDLRNAFDTLVIQPFLTGYRSGLTPNPCILCNQRVKFGLLLKEATRLGAESLATGHYVRLLTPDDTSDRFRLQRARDCRKDQSYFLYGLSQHQLAKALFPLGNALKEEVLLWTRQNVPEDRIPEESQEICFIPAGHYKDFLKERLEGNGTLTGGQILDKDGNVLGRHQGISAYTVGQRRGLGIPSTAPYYVLELDPVNQTVRVGREEHLYRREMMVAELNWVSIPPPDEPIHCQVRIRNQHQPAQALVTPGAIDRAVVCFDSPQRAISPGQAAVFYDQDLLLGGGVITRELG